MVNTLGKQDISPLSNKRSFTFDCVLLEKGSRIPPGMFASPFLVDYTSVNGIGNEARR
jgi:hypothetical protein